MKHLVEFPLQSGGFIVVEVDEPEEAGPSRVTRGDKIEKVKENFHEPFYIFADCFLLSTAQKSTVSGVGRV